MTEQQMYDETIRQQYLAIASATELSKETQQELQSRSGELVALLAALIAQYLPNGWQRAGVAQRAAFLNAHKTGVQNIVEQVFSGFIPKVEKVVSELSTVMQQGYGVTSPTLFAAHDWSTSTLIGNASLEEWKSKQSSAVVERLVRAGRDKIDSATVPQIGKATDKAIRASLPGLDDMAEAFLMNAADSIRQYLFPDMSWRYSAVLDGHTCGTCAADHGKIFKPKAKRPSLPRHVRCRCMYVPLASHKEAE